jgi:hypothetical protein
MKKDALTSLKICLPKAKAKNLMRKKCGKEDIHFARGSAGTVLICFSKPHLVYSGIPLNFYGMERLDLNSPCCGFQPILTGVISSGIEDSCLSEM